MKKVELILLIGWMISFPLFSQETIDQIPKEETALLLIDIQDFYFSGGTLPLVHPEEAAARAAQALTFFRQQKMKVVHVKHEAKNFSGIYKSVRPVEGERVFTKTDVNAFLGTGLDAYLRSQNIRYLVIAGMMTHMCLEAAARAAHDLGYHCIVLGDACATRDLVYQGDTIPAAQVHVSTLATLDRYYGRVVTLEDFFPGVQ